MKLLLKRKYKKSKYTIGDLYIDGIWIANTLEDTDRGLTLKMSIAEILKKKVYGNTAIPIGTYKIVTNIVSPKFKNRAWAKPYDGKLPRLLAVPGYEGVLIHVGNKPEDTLGCILVGYNRVKGLVVDSTKAFNTIMSLLNGKTDLTITIE